jgi:hypothetical protein
MHCYPPLPVDRAMLCHHLYVIFCYLSSHVLVQFVVLMGLMDYDLFFFLFCILPSTVPYIQQVFIKC